MATKTVQVDGLGDVQLYKRKNARSIRMSIAHNGAVRVTMPYWVPYAAGLEFAKTKREWALSKRSAPALLAQGMRIGKAHRLHFVAQNNQKRVASRIHDNGQIVVRHPANLTINTPSVQQAAERVSIRALKLQAKQLLPERVAELAQKHGFTYKQVEIKQLKSRWGSCSNEKVITLNCFLMLLPWHLIDYVILHELMHTQIMAHGSRFWTALGEYIPNLPAIRKDIRSMRPVLGVPQT